MDSYNNHLQDHMFSSSVAGSLHNTSHAQDLDIDHVQHNLNAFHNHHQQNPAFNARSSFNSYPNTTRLSISTGANQRLAYTNGGQSHLTSPTMSHMQFMDPRPSLDGFPSMGARQVPPPPAPQGHVLPGSQMQISSQTPYGPHVASGPTASGMLPAGVSYLNNAPPHGAATQHAPPAGQQGPVQHEEISTIFVVGFPDDMQEREFQNMFTFSLGFEAATLKIPNKESTSYGAGANASSRYAPHNDPYNLVTVNQGGVVVDGGRDGTMSSWPPAPEDAQLPQPQPSNNNAPQRKQIIGFAKFRSREEAIAARDALQGRRVDMEKGSVLKAEMAKKNLHTKRGVGIGTTGYSQPPSSNPAANSAAANLLSGGLQNVNMPMMQGFGAGQDAMFAAGVPGGVGTEALSARERELGALGAMGLGSGRPTWRDMHKEAVSDDERGPVPLNLRGMRDQPQEDLRRANGIQDSFRAMSALSPASETNGFFHNDPLWAKVHAAPQAKFPPRPPSSSRRSTSPETSSTSQRDFSPPHDRKPDMRRPSQSSASSVSGSVDAHSNKSATGLSDDESMAMGMRSLALNVANANGTIIPTPSAFGVVANDAGATSPQLPSPGSSSASTSTRHSVDANPPINTLYVGNLPSSVTGHPPEHLEESLKALFAAQPGYRRLCFRQKSNGPMCFVEFEDVSFATKALNDLYGHTLDGLVKAPGIRLSYSKNPLGVRTPTSAGSNGSSLQQQQQQNSLVFPPEAFALRGDERRRDATVSPPPVFGNNYMGSPPPRFSSPNYGGALPANNFSLGGAMYGGFSNSNNPSSFANFSLATPQLGAYNNEQASDVGRPLSPQHTIEATRAA
ncbi:hypothetical protein HDZ31DRAFT_48205 [Schizophyllum fasciatum]